MAVSGLLPATLRRAPFGVMQRQCRWCHGVFRGYTGMARIELSKTSLLVDEPLEVVVSGLEPTQEVTVSALLDETGKVYASCGQFISDGNGRLNLSTAPSQGGTYTGISGMGLFWSMQPTPDMRKGLRLLKADVTTPLVTRIDVHRGHVSVPDPRHPPSHPLVSTEVRRWYKSPDVDRIVMQDGELVGTLFVPKGAGPYPGVVDVFGSIGGVVESRAALLASRGFITFALGYIDYEQTDVFKGDIQYYEKAVNLLRNHPRVNRSGIGMIGTSKGSDVCLLTSIFNANVKAVVSIGGTPWVTGWEHVYKDRTMSATGLVTDLMNKLRTTDGAYEQLDTEEGQTYAVHIEKALPESFIPVERTHAQLLCISGGDDPFVTDRMVMMISDRLKAAGRTDVCAVLRYPRAGHLLEPPYAPHCRVGYFSHLGSYFVWGGYPREHAHAQEDMWTKIIDFFNRTLSTQPPPHKL